MAGDTPCEIQVLLAFHAQIEKLPLYAKAGDGQDWLPPVLRENLITIPDLVRRDGAAPCHNQVTGGALEVT